MEKNVAILMADLSGYTALTETHGAFSAADLIDKYIQIAEQCLVGDSHMHERTGDELMFISDSPDALLATALQLEATAASEDNFLQVHGGLHFGKVLSRGKSYFGSTINLVSRISSKAAPGTFWCSDDFVNAITDKTVCNFTPKGSFAFKNINGEKEVFELDIEKLNPHFIDPVCRMLILDPKKAVPHPQDSHVYFCSAQCLGLYLESK